MHHVDLVGHPVRYPQIAPIVDHAVYRRRGRGFLVHGGAVVAVQAVDPLVAPGAQPEVPTIPAQGQGPGHRGRDGAVGDLLDGVQAVDASGLGVHVPQALAVPGQARGAVARRGDSVQHLAVLRIQLVEGVGLVIRGPQVLAVPGEAGGAGTRRGDGPQHLAHAGCRGRSGDDQAEKRTEQGGSHGAPRVVGTTMFAWNPGDVDGDIPLLINGQFDCIAVWDDRDG